MRAQLKQFFKSAAAHHATMATLHKERMDGEEEDSPAHTFHKGAAAAHAQHGLECSECAKGFFSEFSPVSLGRAEEDELDKLQPTGVSAVAPTAPGVHAVPRAGARPLLDSSRVPEPFRHLVKSSDDEEGDAA
jgi:hypothetical protein